MTRDQIIGRVNIKLEEISDEPGQIIENPLIDEILDETADELQLMVPRFLLKAEALIVGDSTTNQVLNADGTGYITLPADFLRLAYFKLEEWAKAVVDPISEDHPNYVNQHNIYTRGKPAKPVCVLRYDAEAGTMILEYFSAAIGENETHTVERAAYIPRRKAEDLQDNLIDPLTWLVVAKVLQIYSADDNAAKNAIEKVATWIMLNRR